MAQNILLLLLYNKLAAQNVQLALKRSPVCDGVRRVGDKRQLFQNGRLHFTGQVCQQQLAVGIAVRVHLIAHAGGNMPGLAALYQVCDDDAPVRVQRAEAHGFARGGLKPRQIGRGHIGHRLPFGHKVAVVGEFDAKAVFGIGCFNDIIAMLQRIKHFEHAGLVQLQQAAYFGNADVVAHAQKVQYFQSVVYRA